MTSQQVSQELESDLQLRAPTLQRLSVFAERKVAAPQGSYLAPIMLTFAAVAIVGILAHMLLSSVRPSNPPITPQWTPPLPTQVEVEPELVVGPVEAVAQLPPVRLRNAFDESEVFEFPAGTSDEEARTAVANILKRRAHDRQ